MKKTLLFVCTGNTCRSPLAAAFARQVLDKDRWQVLSCGLAAAKGLEASQGSRQAAGQYGLDLSSHRSTGVSRELLDRADLVLAMSRGHLVMLARMFPQFKEKFHLLKEFVGLSGDVADPFGGSQEEYDRCAAELKSLVEALAAKLKEEDGEGRHRTNKGDKDMRIAIGSDHGGFGLKQEIIRHLERRQVEVKDFGAFDESPSDYPDFAGAVAKAVADGEYDLGILVCGTGVGVSIAANKVPGIRAALCHDTFSARMARRHNDANILALGERVVGRGLALDIVDEFLKGTFDGGRHARRVEKIKEIEARFQA